jgi:hypothetical protein
VLLSQDDIGDGSEVSLPAEGPRRLSRVKLGQLALSLGVVLFFAGLCVKTSPASSVTSVPVGGAGVIQANLVEAPKTQPDSSKPESKKVAWSGATPHSNHTKTGHKHPVRVAERNCVDVPGLILAQDDPSKVESLWAECSVKWSADCRSAGCCADWNMKCFEKDKAWSACNTDCKTEGDKNETWSCNVLWPAKPRTYDTCAKACKDDPTCHAATFSADNGGSCKLSSSVSTRVVWASDAVNSTICGFSSQRLQELQSKVKEQLPWVMPQEEAHECSWSDEDCTTTQCCNDVSCSKDFSQCYGYSCYKKTDYYAGCRLHAPPEDWNGTWLCGPRELKVTGPAGGKVKLMSTTLYCFIVATWDAPPAKPFWSPERDLVENIKTNGVSIMQCDMHDFFDGAQTEVAEWGSFSNIDTYQQIWQEVKNRGDYAKMDWTVKVDSDAVFFPDRLKMHLDKLRVPSGARVYIENNDYRFRFMGALEVVSKPAMDIWLEKSHTCIRGKHEGGEDFFMRGCMDALGIDHMIDHSLLWDKYAGQDVHCTDGWAVAFHFHKSIIRWNWCYNEVMCGGRAKCDQGMEVEYVMED